MRSSAHNFERAEPLTAKRPTATSCLRRGVSIDPDVLENKRQRLIDSATRSFLAHGYERANLEDISINAGVGKLAIYRLFNDKSDLFAKVILHAVEAMAKPLRRSLMGGKPLQDTLKAFAENYAAQMMRPVIDSYPFYEVARLLIGMSLINPALAMECSRIFARDIGEPLINYMDNQIKDGKLADLGGQFLTQYFTQSLFFTNGVILNPASAPMLSELRDHAKRTVSLFLHGCMVPAQL